MVIHIVNGFKGEKPSFLQFIRKTEQLFGWILAPREPNTAAPAPASGLECGRARDRERSRRAGQLSFGLPGPTRRLKPGPHADYEGFRVRFGDPLLEKNGEDAANHQIRNDDERTLALIHSSNIFQMLGLCAQT